MDKYTRAILLHVGKIASTIKKIGRHEKKGILNVLFESANFKNAFGC